MSSSLRLGEPWPVVATVPHTIGTSAFDDVWTATREQVARYWIESVEPTLGSR